MHNAALLCDGVKMSKSLGNLVLVRELLAHYSPDAIRLCLLRHHYRRPFEYRVEEMEVAARDAEALQAAVRRGGDPAAATADQGNLPGPVEEVRNRFVAALADDLNTPLAAQCLLDLTGLGHVSAPSVLRDLGSLVGLRLDR